MDNAMRNILDAAREYGFFQHREDVADYDWTKADLGIPWGTFDLDLSTIVPEHAHAVLFRCEFVCGPITDFFRLRRKGYTNNKVCSVISAPVAGVRVRQDMIVGIGPDRTLQTYFEAANVQTIDLVVKGWWF